MAHGARYVKLDGRTARVRLPPRHAAYWTLISPACSLRYRRGPGSNGGVWLAKYSPAEARRVQNHLAAADDWHHPIAGELLS